MCISKSISLVLLSILCIKITAQQNIDKNVALPKPQVMLIAAEEKNNLSDAKRAISAGADVNGVNTYGTPLIWSSLLRGNLEMVLTLLKSGAKITDYNGKSFAQALLNKAVSIYKGILLHKIEQDSQINSAAEQLSSAIECLSLLLSQGVNFSNIVSESYDGKKQDVADFFTDFCEKIIFSWLRPDLHNAALELAQQLTNSGYPVVNKLWNMGNISLYASPEWVKMCVKNGVDINQKVNKLTLGLYPMSALSFVLRDYEGIGKTAVPVLIDAGANVNQFDYFDGENLQTPLDWAESRKPRTNDIIGILLKYGAKTSKQLHKEFDISINPSSSTMKIKK